MKPHKTRLAMEHTTKIVVFQQNPIMLQWYMMTTYKQPRYAFPPLPPRFLRFSFRCFYSQSFVLYCFPATHKHIRSHSLFFLMESPATTNKNCYVAWFLRSIVSYLLTAFIHSKRNGCFNTYQLAEMRKNIEWYDDMDKLFSIINFALYRILQLEMTYEINSLFLGLCKWHGLCARACVCVLELRNRQFLSMCMRVMD